MANAEWGMGIATRRLVRILDFASPIPHSPFPIL
jgi:hypothetical protein